jgi:O-antigen ligase
VFYFILFFIFFAVLSWWRLDRALMLLLAAFPAYVLRFDVFGLPSTILEGMILISFAVWFLKYTNFKNFIRGKYFWKDFLENRKKRIFYPFGMEIILLLIVSSAAAGVAGFSLSALGIWKAYFFEPFLLYVLLLNVFGKAEKNKGISKIIFSLAVGALAVSIYAIFQKITGLGISNSLWAASETRRVVSFFGYPNAVGLYLGPIIIVLAGYVLAKTKEKSSVFSAVAIGVIIILSLFSVYFAKSEGALIGLLSAFIVFGLLSGRKFFFATLAVLAVAAVGIFSCTPMRVYALKKITLMDFSGQVRRAQWSETWEMLKDDNCWLFGAGLANYQTAVAPYHIEGIFYDDGTDPEFYRHVVWNDEYKKKVWRPVEIYLYPHNIILNFWSELGLAGLLLFVWIIGKFFFIGISNLKFQSSSFSSSKERFLTIGIICSMVVILVHGLVDVPYFKNDLACIFWVLIVLTVLLRLDLTTREKSIK